MNRPRPGLGTFFGSPGYEPGRFYATASALLAVFRDEQLFFEPGSLWRYSNAGFAVLEAIIERSADEPFGLSSSAASSVLTA